MSVTMLDNVKAGTVWLDLNYPGWYREIDLAYLDMSQGDRCILGQTFVNLFTPSERYREARKYNVVDPDVGYYVLANKHEMNHAQLESLGFFLTPRSFTDSDGNTHWNFADGGYDELAELWTQVILDKRLADHPDTAALISQMYEHPEIGIRIDRPHKARVPVPC